MIEDIFGDHSEGLADVGVGLCRCLDVFTIQLLGKRLPFFR